MVKTFRIHDSCRFYIKDAGRIRTKRSTLRSLILLQFHVYKNRLLHSNCQAKLLSRPILKFNRLELSSVAARVFSIKGAEECIILKRLNRFTVKIILDGKAQRAYINNTGRLLDYIVEGQRGFCIKHERKLKTDCRLFAVREKNLAAIIDTQLQMKTLEKIMALNLVPWIRGCQILKRNAKLGGSLIDYLLECNGKKVYLEVKSAVLRNGKYAIYPDCPSMRGRRHIAELTNHVKNGGHGVILFIAALPNVKAFKPNSSADPEMSRLLIKAMEAGVNIHAFELYYNPEDYYVYLSKPDLPVELI